MRPVVVLDRGNYWEVLGDYSQSPRHAAMIEPVWIAEYANSPSYTAMRNSQVGSKAMFAPVGIGKWLKDWSGPYKPS